MVGRVVDAVTVEYHEIVFYVFHLFQECLENIRTLVQVVENNGCKRIGICFGCGECIEIRLGNVAELFAICLVLKNLL